VVGFDTRLLARRKSVNPGTSRSMSSIVSAGLAARSALEIKIGLPGASDNFISLRVAETTICSLTPSGRSVKVSCTELETADQSCSAEEKPFARTRTEPDLSGTDTNEKLPEAFVLVADVSWPACSVTSASTTAAPLLSCTEPETMHC
jgi:hypothetical protein